MQDLIEAFPGQLQEAVSIALEARIQPSGKEIRNVFLCGLGGSAFGGEVVANIIQDECPVPFLINREYSIPASVGPHSLVIISSYSGNTETLSAFDKALDKGSEIVCITSGGKVLDLAKSNGFSFIQLPGGYPPRAAAGFSIVQLLKLLESYNLISDKIPSINKVIDHLKSFSDHDEAKEFAKRLKGNLVALYASGDFASTAIRWRQQIEENGKQFASHHIIPEMNHNELVGWKQPHDMLKKVAAVFLRSDLDHERVKVRFDLSEKIISDYAGDTLRLVAKGADRMQQLFYLIHFGDWVSLYLAIENSEEPTPVKVIDFLKGELAKY